MAPEPLVLPDLHQAQRLHACESRPEILHNVLWPHVIRLCADARIEQAAWFQSVAEVFDRLYGLDQMLKDVHRRDEIEAVMRQPAAFEINVCRWQLALLK